MLFKSTAILAGLALVQAVPTTITEGTIMDLISRQNSADKFRDTLPGCGVDPSYATDKSSYKIEQGVKVPKQGSDDACTSGHKGSHCW